MEYVKLIPDENAIRDFIPPDYLPKGSDAYHVRNRQAGDRYASARQLKADEIELLVKNGNSAHNWEDIWVTEPFEPDQVKNNEFFGMVRLGKVEKAVVKHHDLKLPAGIYNSIIVDCDIGDNASIHNVRYMAHYIIGHRCILLNIDEMHTTNHAKFGNGILKEGEPEAVRIWLDVMNEAGSRSILPFDGMIPADAYIWAKYRDDAALQKKLVALTEKKFDATRGYYGRIGDHCVIKHTRILKDVKIGSCCYIKGANKLKNITINSSVDERSQIGEGVELVNGIVGYRCHVFYGCKAVRFIMGNNSKLTYGARLIHSFLGDNSTISCCEVLNNLIFPAHEQHHNNSFLVAAVCMGQSNVAAGATIGSNHNSRANDNEVEAGRGFWPGLCTSIKHSSKFASFTLLAKGAYPAEMNIPLPFSLLNNNKTLGQLEVMPGFWWLYNMYALARNTWKLAKRDSRLSKVQHIEFDTLAPDTVEELLAGMGLLEKWTARAKLQADGQSADSLTDGDWQTLGAALLNGPEENVRHLRVLGEGMEKSRRDTVIIHPHRGYRAYRQMAHIYAVRNILAYLESHPDCALDDMHAQLSGPRITQWVNLGGQLSSLDEVNRLRTDIVSGQLDSWDAIHRRYDALWESYPQMKQKHAYGVLCALLDIPRLTQEAWHAALKDAIDIQEYICHQVRESRKKDFDNPFRQATYRSEAEMTAAIGTIDENAFVNQVKEETQIFKEKVKKLMV